MIESLLLLNRSNVAKPACRDVQDFPWIKADCRFHFGLQEGYTCKNRVHWIGSVDSVLGLGPVFISVNWTIGANFKRELQGNV